MAVPAVHPSLLATFGIATLVLWRVYSRVRRMVGRQALRPRRLRITLVVFPLLLALLMLASLAHPINVLCLCAGTAAGMLLGVCGLHLTRFEVSGDGLFYTPNTHLGIALSLVFIGRIVYRFVSLQVAGDSSSSPPTGFAGSPLTLLIFATLAGYYVSYAIGLRRWSHSVSAPVADALTVERGQTSAGAGETDAVSARITVQGSNNEYTANNRTPANAD